MEEEKQEISIKDKVLCKVEQLMERILTDDMQPDAIKCLGDLVDIHKDLKYEDYMEIKEEYYMRYRDYEDSYGNYGNYGENSYGRRSRDSRGRYTENYGRRGVAGSGRGRYRGEDMLDEMYSAYSDYMDSNEYGTYGTGESMQKIEIMADSLMDFIHHLKKEAKTPEEKQLIDEKLKEIGRM